MRRILYVIIFFCIGQAVFSQNSVYKFRHLSTNEGLSQSSVTAIQQDDLGQIWIGTRDGLNKYDGTEFTVFRHDKNNPSSVCNNDILCLEKDSDGSIWVGTYSGVSRYNTKKNTFKTYLNKNNNTSLKGNTVWRIKELSSKEVWIGAPYGISIYNRKTDSFRTFSVGEQVYTIYETKNGAVFLGTKNGLKQFIGKKNNNYQFKTIKETKGVIIQDIIENSEGNLLLGTRTKSVLEYRIKQQQLVPYFSENVLEDKNKNVRQLLFDTTGQLWIGSFNGIQISDENKNPRVLQYNLNDVESINDNFIKVLFKDKKGSIWIGTYYGGINIWDESNINFIKITQKPGNTGLGFKVVSSIKNNKELIYFGTEGGGVSILNAKTKTIEYLNTKNTPGLKSDNIKALYLDKGHYLWMGTFENGLDVFNLKTQKIETHQLPKALNSYLSDVGVVNFCKSPTGEIFIGTTGKGVVNYNIEKQTFKIIDENTKPSGLTNGIIRSIKVDSKNNIWVCTLKGLNLIQPNGIVKKYFYDSVLREGESSTVVFEDSKGGIWLGTDVDGLFKYSKGKFQQVDFKSNDCPVIGIKSIIEDPKHNFWISSANQGVFYFNPSNSKTIANYTQKEGLASNQFNTNASLCINKTSYFFGGPSGAVYFNTNKLVKNKYAPQVIITDFKIKNKSVLANDESNLLTDIVSYTQKVDLSYLQGNFSINFSIPNYINSSSNRYLYRLKGLENDWIETSQNSAFYTIQNPGNYTFEVKGVNNDGVVNTVATMLKIRVNPAPWRTWWAFLLYGIVIFTALYYLLAILKSKSALKLQLDLEHQDVEKIKEVNKAKLEFFTNISHEFRTPLTLILGPLNQILENYKGSSVMYKKLKVIESSSNHLLQLINRLMDFRKLESNLMKLESAEGNVVKFLKEIYFSFSEYAKDGNYEYSFQTNSEEILVFYDRYKLERVFFNLISNAFRYTPKNGKITLRIVQEKECVKILVEDSGVGIAKEYRDIIFERFFEVSINNKPDSDYNKGTGIGLSIVKNIVDLHKGTIKVDSNENNKGSIFIVELPLGNKHLEPSEIIHDFKFSDDLSQYVNQLEEQPLVFEDNVLDDLNSAEKPNILLVEDNKPLRKFMRDLLSSDYHVLEAENGKVGFKTAVKEQVDLIVSDVVMPQLSGTELCSMIKEDIRTSHIPVLLLTSRSSLIYKLEGLESGADDYISKPFSIKEFKLRIKNSLSSAERLKKRISATDALPTEDLELSTIDERLYKKALGIVEKNIGNEQFDVLFFCEELGVSRTVLFRKVKAWTDFSPNEFIQQIRLKKGAELLEQGDINISQISYQLGFKNPKYFSKCFRKKFGKTPTEYAKTFSDF